jgi:hypothetical protein
MSKQPAENPLGNPNYVQVQWCEGIWHQEYVRVEELEAFKAQLQSRGVVEIWLKNQGVSK